MPDHGVQQSLQAALAQYRAGNPLAAEKLCRQVLSRAPNNVDALNLLGGCLYQTGNLDEAIEVYQRIAALKPNLPEAHNNLGGCLQRSGRIEDAIAAFKTAIRLKPEFPVAKSNLAAACFEWGNALSAKGQTAEALEAFQQAVALKPDFIEAYNDLGIALQGKGQLDEAIASFRQAIRLKPDLAEGHNNLGIALKDAGQLEEAIAALRHAIWLKPDFADAHNNLGNALKDKEQLDEAIAAYRQAVRLKPDFAEAHSNLGALVETGQLDEAIASQRQAVRLKPDDAGLHSNLIYILHFHPGYDGGMIHEELRRWNRQHAEPLKKLIQPHANDRDPDRRLRIGYVSPDFREHVVGQNLLPLLREHDHGQMEIFCYANLVRADARTGQFRRYADVWRGIAGLSDSQSVDLIRQDRIDILVDLTLHMARNRLAVFARKPAPVQVTYLAYAGSSGLTTMDYRLSDPYLDPAGADESVYSEQTIRLPETYWCYGVAGPAPDPSPPPAATMGHVTFGCLNNFAKVSPPALDLWAQILQEVPRSRLIVHSHPGAHLDGVRKRFAGKGISPDRLEFPSQQPWPEYMRTYGRIDIAVDPFPWGGGITTCEALWMGVPVVSLAGRTAVGRGGASILANVGVPELVARTPQQYVQIAAALAGDLPRLGELRRTLRGRMQASPLMDAPRFARNIEAAYRQMWRNWCERGGNSSLQCPDDAVQQFLHAALAQYRAGNSLAAEKLCRQVLSLEPNNVDALNLLGGCLFQIGNLNEAIEVYQRIAALKPDLPEVHNNLGGCLQRSGRLVDAIAAFKTAIKLKPDFPVAISNLVAAYLEWGNALSAKGQTAEALEAFQQAVALKPDFIEALDKIGQCLQLLENLDGAIAAFQTIIRLKPDTFEAFNNLGIALQGRAQLDEAIACFRQAVRLKPDLAEAHNNLGNALRAKGQVDGAIVALREAVRLKPAFADAHSNLGVALTELGQLHEAIAAYRRAIELKSDFAQAHWNYALLLLMLGVFEEGWKEFEWGLRVRRLRLGRDLPQPRWTGQDAPGKTILLVSDGRFGDAMHFIRYAPLVAERGATVLLECQTELAPLLNRVQGISAVFVRGEQLPEFHWQTPLLSLPLVFGTTMKTIPADVPYLSAPPDRIEQWAKRLAGDSSFKVGLAWAGSARRDARSCPLETFAPLAAVPGVTFYGLQKGPEANQPVPPGLRLIQMGDELHDFADTAALVSNLDLVISVDTSVAHLTGGMGRPVWTLIPFNPGFQWLRDRADSPWYPTMRLFRQTTPGDWLDVVRRVAQHLEMSKRKT